MLRRTGCINPVYIAGGWDCRNVHRERFVQLGVAGPRTCVPAKVLSEALFTDAL